MDLKKLFGGKKMRKVYEGRIIGFGFIAFIVGVLGFAKFGIDIVWLSVPLALLWLFDYDLSSYEAKNGVDEDERKSVRRNQG